MDLAIAGELELIGELQQVVDEIQAVVRAVRNQAIRTVFKEGRRGRVFSSDLMAEGGKQRL